MIKLRAQHLRKSDWHSVAEQLEVFFHEEVIAPVLKIVRAETRQDSRIENAAGDSILKRALRSGKIQYTRGVFSGDFSATTSSAIKALGGVFDKRAGVFRLEPRLAPQWVTAEASAYFARAHLAHEAIRRELDAALDRVNLGRYDVDASRTIASIDEGWRASAAQLEVKPELTKEGKEALAENYSRNLDLYIKKWLKKDIFALRKDVQANAESGYRFDNLIERIQHRNNVGKSKAKFLARQETGLFMSEYREQRFAAAGVTKYQWSTSHDSRVRPAADLSPRAKLHAGNHRVLDGRIFEYKNPPIVDPNTGRRANPGRDYNCLPGDARIDFGGGIEKCFRRAYRGELTTLILESGKTIRATPNHPVLTTRGWKPIGSVNKADELVDLSEDLLLSGEGYRDQRVPTIRQVFEAYRESGLSLSFPGQRKQFHGDGADGDVDVVHAAGSLIFGREPRALECGEELSLASPDLLASRLSSSLKHCAPLFSADGLGADMRSRSKRPALLGGHPSHSNSVCFGAAADSDVGLKKSAPDHNATISGSFGDGKLTLPVKVSLNDRTWVKLQAVGRGEPRAVLSSCTAIYRGHVYNLQTSLGYYTTGGLVVSNCRCVDIPIVDQA